MELDPRNYEIIFGGHDECLFILAVLSQDFTQVREMIRLDKKSALEEKDEYGNSPLMYALTLENPSIIKELLLASRHWINVPNIYGQTPLMAALKDGMHTKTVIQNSPNVNARDTLWKHCAFNSGDEARCFSGKTTNSKRCSDNIYV